MITFRLIHIIFIVMICVLLLLPVAVLSTGTYISIAVGLHVAALTNILLIYQVLRIMARLTIL